MIEARHPGNAAEQSPERQRVLIVDDNFDAAEMLALALEHLGYETRIAHDGPEALRVTDEQAADAVLLDIGLPGMDGYQLARELRARQGKQPTLIALSGYGSEQARTSSQEAGMDAYLVKPVMLDELAALLKRLAGNP